MMHMTFYWGKNVTLLFDFWKTNSWITYSFTLFTCFLFSFLYHYLERCRLDLKSPSSLPPTSGIDTPLLIPMKINGRWRKLLVAALFGVNSVVGYMLMLAVMSFNGGVFLAIVFGLSVGYFVFRCDEEEEEKGVGLDSACACA